MMFKRIKYFIFMLLTFVKVDLSHGSCKCGQRNVSGSSINRIIGGKPASRHPWQVGLLSASNHGGIDICGGTIISSKYVLTAAHCTYAHRSIPHGLLVRVGSSDILAGGFTIYVRKIINHPNYQFQQRQWGVWPIANDISLLQLARPITFNQRIMPICLPQDNTNYPVSTKAVAVGWGQTNPGPMGMPSRYLMEAQLTIMGYSRCCVKTMDYHTGACNGDSGGPLMVVQNGR